MNPNELLRFAEKAKARGWTTEQINTRLKEVTGGDIGSMTALRAAAEQFEGGDVPGGAAGATVRSAARGAAANFLDEASGLAAGVGAALVPGGEGFNEARRRVTEESRGRAFADRQAAGSFLNTAGNVAGSLLPAGRIFQGVRGLTRLGPAAAGAVSGAIEGGLFGTGAGRGLEDRATRGGIGAAAGGILGGAAGATGGRLVAGRKASKMKPKAGARLGQAARDASGLEGRASGILDQVDEGKRAARKMVRPLEKMGREEIPREVSETVMKSPLLRKEAERIAPSVVKAADDAGELARFSFDELDTIARSIRNDASAFQQAAGSDLPANVRPVNVKKAEAALEELDDVMGKHLEDFPEFRARWAELKETGNALTEGRKLFGRTADDFVSGFEDLESEAARKAYREGGATELVARLESLSEPKATLRQIVHSPQERQKLRVIMGDDGLRRFTQAAEDEQILRDLAHDYEAVARFVRRYLPWTPVAGAGSEGTRRVVGGILDDGNE